MFSTIRKRAPVDYLQSSTFVPLSNNDSKKESTQQLRSLFSRHKNTIAMIVLLVTVLVFEDEIMFAWMKRELNINEDMQDLDTQFGGTSPFNNENNQNLLWWEESLAKQSGQPSMIYPLPIHVSSEIPNAILDVLKYINVKASDNDAIKKNAIIDIGLPKESIVFAKAGYRAHGFEPRKAAYDHIQNLVRRNGVQELVTLHHAGLSNVSTATTMEIFNARESSSFLKSAIEDRRAHRKFRTEGETKEIVPVHNLDHFMFGNANDGGEKDEVVAIKVDTQGVEPEVFMGAQKLLSQHQAMLGPPYVILMEYDQNLRNPSELNVGPRILMSLGYKCYLFPHGEESTSLKRPTSPFQLEDKLQNSEYNDFLCVRSQVWNEKEENVV